MCETTEAIHTYATAQNLSLTSATWRRKALVHALYYYFMPGNSQACQRALANQALAESIAAINTNGVVPPWLAGAVACATSHNAPK